MAKILIVEDDPIIQKVLQHKLHQENFETIVAKDGGEGLETAVAQSPDLILMDLRMPVMDGWEATRRLKATPETAAIPVIALTAAVTVEERQRCLDAGCADYVAKPVQFDQLLAKLRELLPVS